MFLSFLQYLVHKNKNSLRNNKPAGLTPISTLVNVFFCSVKKMDQIMMFDKPFSEFPFPCFFIRSLGGAGIFIEGEEIMKGLERIGGTFTHLESELAHVITQFTDKNG